MSKIKKLLSCAILALFAFCLFAPKTAKADSSYEFKNYYMLFWGAEQDVMDNSTCYPKNTASDVELLVSEIDYPVRAWVIGSLQQRDDVFANCSGGNDYYITGTCRKLMDNTVHQWNYTHAGIQMMTIADEQAFCRGQFAPDVY